MSRFRYIGLLVLLVSFHPAYSQFSMPSYPSTKYEPVAETRFGIEVIDPYRWMEAPDSHEFAQWLKRQDILTSDVFLKIPKLNELKQRVTKNAKETRSVRNLRKVAGFLLFLEIDHKTGKTVLRSKPLLNQSASTYPILSPLSESWEMRHVLEFEPDSSGTRIAVKETNHDGAGTKIVVVNLSDGHEMGEQPEPYVDFRWMGNDLLLSKPDGSWHLHSVGEKLVAETIVLGDAVKGCPNMKTAIATQIRTSANSPLIAALIAAEGESSYSLYVTDFRKRQENKLVWEKLADSSQEIEDATPYGDTVFALSSSQPDGKCVVEFVQQGSGYEMSIVVPPKAGVLDRFSAARDGLYLLTINNLQHELKRMDWSSKELSHIELPFSGSIRGPIGSPSADHVLVGLETWNQPVTWYEVGRKPDLLPCNLTSENTAIDLETTIIIAKTSNDDSIPISVVKAKGNKTNKPIVWVMAYGAYGIAQTPRYLGGLKTFLDDGGIYAVAHIRGGGEWGTAWHQAGRGIAKSNTYKDLIACVERLIESGIATAGRVAIEGVSGGGPVVGMFAMKRPDLARVVFDKVGDNNTLRLHVTPDGPFMIEEWGTPETEEGFKSLLEMDVTWHVRSGVRYPAFYLTAGGRDTSVPPWMPGKLAAHLQTHSIPHPILLRVDHEGGHIANPEIANQQLAEQIAFLYWQMGEEGYQPR